MIKRIVILFILIFIIKGDFSKDYFKKRHIISLLFGGVIVYNYYLLNMLNTFVNDYVYLELIITLMAFILFSHIAGTLLIEIPYGIYKEKNRDSFGEKLVFLLGVGSYWYVLYVIFIIRY